MTGAEALKELRIILKDVAAPYGWGDSLLKGYLSEGQDVFCERTGYFFDASAYTITTMDGTATYTLSERIIEPLEMWIGSSPLRKLERLQDYPDLMLSTAKELPRFWVPDHEPGKVRLHPTPDAEYTVGMRVWRRSLTPSETSGALEIPERFHRAPIEYAAFKAYGVQDAELEDAKAAAKHAGIFNSYVLEGKRSIDRLSGGTPHAGGNPLYVV